MDKVSQACLGCPDRVVGCHGKCERYKAYRDAIDSIHAVKDRDKEMDTYQRIKRDKIIHASRRKRRNSSDGGS